MRGNINQKILQKIAVKFIVNLPLSQLMQQRIGYHFEHAYFYYIDTLGLKSSSNWKIKNQQIRDFCEQLLRIIEHPQLTRLKSAQIESLIQENYNIVPVHGIVLINTWETKILMVGSYDKLGFPKGKIGQGETPQQCAEREVYEEIGVRVKVDPQYFIEVDISSKRSTRNLTKVCRFFICKLEESAIVPRHANGEKSNGIRRIMHSLTEIQSIQWYEIGAEVQKLMEQGQINFTSRLVYFELMKKLEKAAKSRIYKEKKSTKSPMSQFQGFNGKKLTSIFID